MVSVRIKNNLQTIFIVNGEIAQVCYDIGVHCGY